MPCYALLFSLVGFPSYVHSDRGTAFTSKELKDYLHSHGIATSHSTPYHSTGNSQWERCNQTVWKTVSLILKGRNLGQNLRELILPDALHAVRTLLCTATNASPHERFFPFSRRSMLGRSLPSWMITPGTVLLKKFVQNKSDPLREEVDLLDANPKSALIQFHDGRETTVSISDLAPAGSRVDSSDSYEGIDDSTADVELPVPATSPSESPQSSEEIDVPPDSVINSPPPLRRSSRTRRPPDRYGNPVAYG